MNEKIEKLKSDFWKENFIHALHKNMTRVNATELTLNDCKSEFEKFSNKYPQIKTSIEYNQTYSFIEIFLSQDIKLRIYVQDRIKTVKGTL